METENRVIVLIDMDCFYCQVEEKLNSELKGKPIAVVQYNPWKGGGIIAVNYVARAMGVTRHMRGDEAKEKCPEIALPSVPCVRGKADISKYRDAGKEVARVLQNFTPLLERASIDEAYLDISAAVHERLKTLNINLINSEMIPNTYALGYESVNEFISDVQNYGTGCMEFDSDNAQMLLVGAVIVSEIRAAVYEKTGFRCSAGIAHNKILAKLVCGMNKPDKQTVLPKHSVNILYQTLSVKKVKHLGGKFGHSVCESLKIQNMGELQKFTEKELQSRFDEKNGTWLFNIARGIDLEPVQARFNPKSIGCCKQFKGKSALVDMSSLKKWLKDLGDEIEDRLEKDALENSRTPKQMVVSFSIEFPDGSDNSSSRSYNFLPDDELGGELFMKKALELLLESTEGTKPTDGEDDRRLKAPVKFLGISVGKFEDHCENKKTKKILDYFTAAAGPSKAKTKDLSVQRISTKKTCDKNFIFKNFFQTTPDSVNSNKIHNSKDSTNCKEVENIEAKAIYSICKPDKLIETTLDKQESFFAKFLKQKTHDSDQAADPRASTPHCNVIEHGDSSNDSNCSTSTINAEINKSIALCEDNTSDIDRVSNMRTLLNTSIIPNEELEESSVTSILPDTKIESVVSNKINDTLAQIQTTKHCFECPDCEKKIPFNLIENHSDYHLAMRLRDEERSQLRKERLIRNNQLSKSKEIVKSVSVSSRVDSTVSIASFLVKFDEKEPCDTCAECGKKVSLQKFSEHLDFHAAQKLNRELNKKTGSTSYFSGNSVKRKGKSLTPEKKSKLPCKSIDSFFR